jgi:hypothetical protein
MRDKRGAVLIYTALATPVFIGTIGLSVDVAGWQAQKRQLQTIADSAAMGGALERIRSGTQASIEPAAIIDATTNGYVAASDTLVVNNPPLSGIRTGNGDSVEVIIRRETPSLFAHIIMPDTAFVSARAVAVGDINDTCIWALNKTKQSAIKVAGSAVVDLDCGIFDNSNDPDSLTQSGSGCLSATNIKTVGGWGADCISVEPITGANPITDPLEHLQTPTNLPSCTENSATQINGGESLTLDPCIFTQPITIVSDGTLHFNPGLYVMDGAGINFSGQSTVTGTDVHFYLTENNDSPSESIDISAGANVTLSAGTNDNHGMAGILIYHDRDAGENVTHNLAGGATMDLEGILYFPTTDVKYAGGSSFDTNASMVIADEVDIVGNTNLGDFDGSAAQANTLLIEAWLAE